ncbi:MAG: hypothetical protein WC341_14220 [Bacteroidales bacterium]|jgi:cell division protein FtsQ
MKKILQISLWLLLLAGVIVITGFAVTEKKSVKCTGLDVYVNDNPPVTFINQAEIYQIIQNDFGTLPGKLIMEINTEQIENTLDKNPYIHDANVYTSLLGEITVDISREAPLVRVINEFNENFYLSQTGKPMPVKEDFTTRAIIATGFISEKYSDIMHRKFAYSADSIHCKSLLTKLQYLASVIEKDAWLNEVIGQIYADSVGEIDLVPSKGDFLIILGGIDDLELRLENLKAFYCAGLPKIGKEKIENINLKYKNQVVCKKSKIWNQQTSL